MGVDWKPVVAVNVKCEMLNVGTVLIFTQHSVKLEINNVSFHSQMASPHPSLSLSAYAAVCAVAGRGKGEQGVVASGVAGQISFGCNCCCTLRSTSAVDRPN